MTDDAPVHPDLQRARYAKNGGDRFLGLWVNLLADARQHADARRTIVRFFKDRAVAAALGSAGEDAVVAHLRDAARLYFATSLTDPQYTSTLLGLKRLPIEEVHGKAAIEVVDTLMALEASKAIDGPAARLPQALVSGFVEALGPDGVAPLRGALAKKPRLQSLDIAL